MPKGSTGAAIPSGSSGNSGSENTHQSSENEGSSGEKGEEQGNGSKRQIPDDLDSEEACKREKGDPEPGYEETEDSISEEEYHLSDEMLSEIAKDIQRALQEGEKEILSERDDDNLDLTPTSKEYKGVRCINYKVQLDASSAATELYNGIVSANEHMIGNIVAQFKRIFRNDTDRKEYRSSGKVNVKRLASGRRTPKVFERRRASENKGDMSAVILVDESGSMNGEKSEVARKTAIILSEVFARLHIPIKVVGFTESCNTVKHYHYQSWKNSPSERYKLLNISAREANFDGYSIRYAGELLSKRQEQHKLLIVISDGYPAASYYASNEDGINDTRNAVQCASKKSKVLGILVGSVSPEKHQYMYGVNFLHIAKVSDLPSALAQRIKRIVKGW